MSVVDYNRSTITQDEVSIMKCLKASGGVGIFLQRPEVSKTEVAHPDISDKDYAFTLRFGSPSAGGNNMVYYSTRTLEAYESIHLQLTDLFGKYDEVANYSEGGGGEDEGLVWAVNVCYEAKEAFEAFLEEVDNIVMDEEEDDIVMD